MTIFCALHICFAFFKQRLCVFDKKAVNSLPFRKFRLIFTEKYDFFLYPNHLPGEPFPERKKPCVGQQRCFCFRSFTLPGRAAKTKASATNSLSF